MSLTFVESYKSQGHYLSHMRTYLSIDCDYFAVESNKVSVGTSAKRLRDVLDYLNKPVFITAGHDLPYMPTFAINLQSSRSIFAMVIR